MSTTMTSSQQPAHVYFATQNNQSAQTPGFYSGSTTLWNNYPSPSASPTTTAAVFISADSSLTCPKRDRNSIVKVNLSNDHQACYDYTANNSLVVQQQPQQHDEQQECQARMKKSRSNNYIAPTKVPKTFTSTMGTLVNDTFSATHGNSRVTLRRQLSGSKLDSYLGNGDSMDVDPNAEATRPRSMSF